MFLVKLYLVIAIIFTAITFMSLQANNYSDESIRRCADLSSEIGGVSVPAKWQFALYKGFLWPVSLWNDYIQTDNRSFTDWLMTWYDPFEGECQMPTSPSPAP